MRCALLGPDAMQTRECPIYWPAALQHCEQMASRCCATHELRNETCQPERKHSGTSCELASSGKVAVIWGGMR